MSDNVRTIMLLYSVAGRIVHEIDLDLIDEVGIGFAQASALLVIDELGEAFPAQLARLTGSQSQSISGLIDRMERGGLLERKRDNRDRRAVRLELTDTGREAAARTRAALPALATGALEGFPANRRETLMADLDWLAARREAALYRSRGGAGPAGPLRAPRL